MMPPILQALTAQAGFAMSFAAVFPGQGSQSLGMMNELASGSALVEQTFQQASEVIGQDLWTIVSDGPEELLSETTITQPLMLAAGVATWRVWQERGGLAPTAMAGHSLGEYSALVAANAMSFETAATLVKQRPELMQAAVPEGSGGMAAILGLTAEQVVEGCAKASTAGVVEAVNFNSPEQTVIGGESAAVDHAMDVLKDMGAKRTVKLAMSVPSHCSLLTEIAETLGGSLQRADLQMPETPVIHNVNADVASSVDTMKTTVASQLFKPVRWVDTITAFEQRSVNTIIEFGPGKVLFGLTRRINRSLGNLTINDLASLDKALAAVA